MPYDDWPKEIKMTERKIKKFIPSIEDWKNFRRYSKIPAIKKLEWLDQYRKFMFQIRLENPSTRKTYEKLRYLR